MKIVLISIVTVVVLVGLIVVLAINAPKSQPIGDGSNVTMVDGKQIITITAKGGYSPWNTPAKANLPTALKVVTNGTFDCSAALAVPSVGYRKMLPPSGETLIEIPPQQVGSVLQGICAMGMYSFAVKFS